jgi:transcriptional regulator with XRE-family HTH domain
VTDLDAYIALNSLVKTHDEEISKPTYRREGFDGVHSFAEIDAKIAAFLRRKREEKGLARHDLAPLLGISTQVYGRYERAFSKLHVTRMIQLCELLGFMPIEMIFEAAPHLWGKSAEDAANNLKMAKLVMELPEETRSALMKMIESLQAHPAKTQVDRVARIDQEKDD